MLAVTIIYKFRTYQINISKELTNFSGPSASNLILAASKPVHQLVSESSFKKGRITFTALSAVVDKERCTMLLGVVRVVGVVGVVVVVVVTVVTVVVVTVVVVRVADEGQVPDIFARPARDAQVSELVNEIANIM